VSFSPEKQALKKGGGGEKGEEREGRNQRAEMSVGQGNLKKT